MRYTPDHKENVRQKILLAVGRGFRAQGYAGIGVDGLAKEAGLTSGAFYAHFSSKAEAFEAAAVAGLQGLRQTVERLQSEDKDGWLKTLAETYLGYKRTCDLRDSCTLQSLTPEVARSEAEIKVAYEKEMLAVIEQVAHGLSRGTLAARRKTAWAIMSLLIGGVTLARATHDAEVGEQIAKSVVQAVLAMA